LIASVIIYPHRIIHRAIFIIQLIAIQIKLHRAGLMLFLIEFLFMNSPIKAQAKGPRIIHRIHQNSQITVHIHAHQVQYLLHPNFFVARIGRKLSIIITAIMIINQRIRKSVENGLPHIK
jgi:hypothetical protein